tara:strand:- start:1135 stop:1437 length:303 start_codon:yes stop_codon:yes gene_type:complete
MKRHTYIVVFNADQGDWSDAQYNVGSVIDQTYRSLVNDRLSNGDVTTVSTTLSDDGLTLNVVRDWEEPANDEWLALSYDLVADVESLSTVTSCTHDVATV